jgi:hypothetical protein
MRTSYIGHILKLEARIMAGQEKLEAGQEKLEARIASIASGQERLEDRIASIASGLERLEALLGSGQRELPAMEVDGLAEGAKIEPVDAGETAPMVSNHVKGKSWEETFRERLNSVRMNANEREHVWG